MYSFLCSESQTNFMLYVPKSLAANCPNVLLFDVHDVAHYTYTALLM